MESSLGYHPDSTEVLTGCHESGDRTLLGGQFDWGGRLLKSNGGAQRFPQNGRKSFEECKGRRGGNDSISFNIVAPVVVKPDMVSKKASVTEGIYPLK